MSLSGWSEVLFVAESPPSAVRSLKGVRGLQAIVIANLPAAAAYKLRKIFPDQVELSAELKDSELFVRAYVEGVSHPLAESLAQVLQIKAAQIRVDSLIFHALPSAQSHKVWAELQSTWREPAIEEVRSENYFTWIGRVTKGKSPKRRVDPSFDQVDAASVGLEFSNDELAAIRAEEEVRAAPMNRTELELIAQTWSEHCKHKIFAATIDCEDSLHKNTRSLFKTHIQKPTLDMMKNPGTHLLSVFHDNAGVVALKDWQGRDTEFAIALKMETHNSPSAIAPYGGASTGLVGVHRDILGTGQGARPIANWDVLCFESSAHSEARPLFALSPKTLRSGILKGIEDGGNQSGIPTVQGSVVFLPAFAVKPYVFAGSMGLLPKKYVHKEPKPSLALYCFGGAVGSDGLRGAVMSSRDLRQDDFSGSAVQVANAFTQRRLTDFLLVARDEGLIDVISDNGAGGLGSSCGEMASLTGGATIDLTALRLKFDDLQGWERLLSESQERMTVGTSKPEKFEELMLQYNIGFDRLGELNESKYLTVRYQGRDLVKLRLEFLHGACPQLTLKSQWTFSKEAAFLETQAISIETQSAVIDAQAAFLSASAPVGAANLVSPQWQDLAQGFLKKSSKDWENLFARLLESEHLCSRKAIQNRFDHEVQGRALRKSFQGLGESSPADGSLIDIPEAAAGASVVLAHALCPWRERIEEQVLFAFDEALRQLVITGAQGGTYGGLDNFCWPDPIPAQNPKSGERHLWRLVRACEVLQQLCRKFEVPLISGKDSMKNNSKDFECPATVLISMGASSVHPSLVPASFLSKANDVVLVLPMLKASLAGSALSRVTGHFAKAASVFSNILSADSVAAELESLANVLGTRYQKVSKLVAKGQIRAAKDIGEGGLGVAIFEMCLGRHLGVHFEKDAPDLRELFEEGLGGFVFVLDPHAVAEVMAEVPDLHRLGVVTKQSTLKWGTGGVELSVCGLQDFYEAKGKEGFFS